MFLEETRHEQVELLLESLRASSRHRTFRYLDNISRLARHDRINASICLEFSCLEFLFLVFCFVSSNKKTIDNTGSRYEDRISSATVLGTWAVVLGIEANVRLGSA